MVLRAATSVSFSPESIALPIQECTWARLSGQPPEIAFRDTWAPRNLDRSSAAEAAECHSDFGKECDGLAAVPWPLFGFLIRTGMAGHSTDARNPTRTRTDWARPIYRRTGPLLPLNSAPTVLSINSRSFSCSFFVPVSRLISGPERRECHAMGASSNAPPCKRRRVSLQVGNAYQ